MAVRAKFPAIGGQVTRDETGQAVLVNR